MLQPLPGSASLEPTTAASRARPTPRIADDLVALVRQVPAKHGVGSAS